jgi:hypothetical protein
VLRKWGGGVPVLAAPPPPPEPLRIPFACRLLGLELMLRNGTRDQLNIFDSVFFAEGPESIVDNDLSWQTTSKEDAF